MIEADVRARNGGHLHAEAFCLMTYATDDGREMEAIWNSRDGVTPFIVHSRSGIEMTHVDWRKDVRNPNHQPRPGDRIFVDITPEIARERAAMQVEQGWDHPEYPIARTFATKTEAIEAFAGYMLERPGEPALIEVMP